MNKDTFKFIIVLVSLSFLPACMNISSSSQNKTKENIVTPKTDGPVEFVFTKEELAAIDKWKKTNEPYEKMVNDALLGDKAALYLIGMSHLTGKPSELFTINVDEADYYFSQSASLGFGPALHQISLTRCDEYNPLAFVYLNLKIAAGHTEFVGTYHKIRNAIVEKSNSSIPKEVERIAQHKWKTILKNQQDFATVTDDKHKFMFLSGKMVNIVDEDILFDINYWQKVLDGKAPDNFEKWLQKKSLFVSRKSAEKAQKRLDASL
jgi:hypothetical protein